MGSRVGVLSLGNITSSVGGGNADVFTMIMGVFIMPHTYVHFFYVYNTLCFHKTFLKNN